MLSENSKVRRYYLLKIKQGLHFGNVTRVLKKAQTRSTQLDEFSKFKIHMSKQETVLAAPRVSLDRLLWLPACPQDRSSNPP